jgi:hypothetical protein
VVSAGLPWPEPPVSQREEQQQRRLALREPLVSEQGARALHQVAWEERPVSRQAAQRHRLAASPEQPVLPVYQCRRARLPTRR